MRGIVGYGAYIPYWRLQRSAIAAALGSGGATGTRSVASYDEDATSMGVEAGRIAVAGLDQLPQSLFFSTTAPPYLDKTNATAIHAALRLDARAGAYDMVGAVRSAMGALCAAMPHGGPAMAVLSDVRIGLPGGADEAGGGDGAAAFVFGDGSPDDTVIAEPIGGAARSAEFLDRWRLATSSTSSQWEERFGEHAYVPLVQPTWTDALDSANLVPDDVDYLIVAGTHTRAMKAVAKLTGVRSEAVVDDLTGTIGNCGAAHFGIVLADVLDRAEPNQVIAVMLLADGCDVIVLRTTAAIVEARSSRSVRDQIARTNDALSYASFLTWRDMLQREPPRRPEPDRAASPPSARSAEWKYGFVGSRDTNGIVHLPPERVAMTGGTIDQMTSAPMADVRGAVATFTVDRLAFSLAPPVVGAIIDFDGGGRFMCELTDVDPAAVAIGMRVEMSFRRLYTSHGIHNYFWKARPC
jgi:hydroxymethylglutaryl-CoA synthase